MHTEHLREETRAFSYISQVAAFNSRSFPNFHFSTVLADMDLRFTIGPPVLESSEELVLPERNVLANHALYLRAWSDFGRLR